MADKLAAGNLEVELAQHVAAGRSPETIAARLYADFGIEVTGATIGNWLNAEAVK